MLRLYNHPLSGNCYKVRLLLSHLGVDYQRINVDIFEGEHKCLEFKKLNPNRKIPVIEDDDFVMWESNAILLYIGRKYSPNKYLSENISSFGLISQWLFFGKTTIDPNLAMARFLTRFAPDAMRDSSDIKKFQDAGHQALKTLNECLGNHDFLVYDYSIAAIACFVTISLGLLPSLSFFIPAAMAPEEINTVSISFDLIFDIPLANPTNISSLISPCSSVRTLLPILTATFFMPDKSVFLSISLNQNQLIYGDFNINL